MDIDASPIDAPAGGDSTVVSGDGSPGDGSVSWALVALAVLPIVVAMVRALVGGVVLIGDDGLLALRVDDVGGAFHPWLGSWTSASISLGVDVNNPGAWYAYLLAPFVALLGPANGSVVGVAIVNVAGIAGAAAAARRIGGIELERWVLAGAALLAWSMGSELLVDIWQPHSLMLPLLAMMVVAAGAAAGRTWCLPWLAGLASLVVQTHLGHAYIIVAVVAGAVGMLAWTKRSERSDLVRDLAGSGPVRATVLVSAVAWLPAVIEQFTSNGRGNLARLADATVSGSGTDEVVGSVDAVRAVGAVFVLPPWWSRRGFANTFSRPSPDVLPTDGLPSFPLAFVATLALVIGLSVLLVRLRHDPVGRGIAATSLVAVGAGFVALSVLAIGPFGFAPHHARWTFPLAAFVHLGVAFVLARGRGPVLSLWIPAAIVVVASLANLPSHAQDQGPVADRRFRDDIEMVLDGVDRLDGSGPLLYDTSTFQLFEPFSGPIMMRLGEIGVDFHVEDASWLRQVGDGRAVDGSEVARLVHVVGDDLDDVPDGWCEIARVAPEDFGLFLAPLDADDAIDCP